MLAIALGVVAGIILLWLLGMLLSIGSVVAITALDHLEKSKIEAAENQPPLALVLGGIGFFALVCVVLHYCRL